MNKYKVLDLKQRGGIGTCRTGVPDDIFLVCASYEQRTTSVAECLTPDYSAKGAVIYYNKEFLEGHSQQIVQSKISKLTELLKDKCSKITTVEGSWLDARIQFTAMRSALEAEITDESEMAITIDTTTFTRESLLISLALLRILHSQTRIRMLYVSPEDHGEWLSRGFRCVRNIMGFPGIQQPSLPTLLAVLSGFEPERVLKLVDEHEPTMIYMGIGDPPTERRFLERNIEEQKLILARQDVEEFRFSAENAMDCRDQLEELLTPSIGNYNIILAPMSTKLSTIAALLVAELHTEIQLTYCVPGEYNIGSYSTGADTLFIDEISGS
jgi:hypothetical protein